MFINKNKNILVQQLKFSFIIFLLFYYAKEDIEAFICNMHILTTRFMISCRYRSDRIRNISIYRQLQLLKV